MAAFQQTKTAEEGKMWWAWLKANRKWCLEYYKVACSFLKHFLLKPSKLMMCYSNNIWRTLVVRDQSEKFISPHQSVCQIWTLMLHFAWSSKWDEIYNLRCFFSTGYNKQFIFIYINFSTCVTTRCIKLLNTDNSQLFCCKIEMSNMCVYIYIFIYLSISLSIYLPIYLLSYLPAYI